MAQVDAATLVKKWREFFETNAGKKLNRQQVKKILDGDAAYQRKHGREELAQAVEKLSRELTTN